MNMYKKKRKIDKNSQRERERDRETERANYRLAVLTFEAEYVRRKNPLKLACIMNNDFI